MDDLAVPVIGTRRWEAMIMRRVTRLCISAAAVAALLLVPTAALAGPRSTPDFGVKNPQNLGCSRDSVKCMTAGWHIDDETGERGAEVHIVDDPLEGEGDASGSVIFWCQSIVGFKYQLSVEGLAPSQVFTVTVKHNFTKDDLGVLGTFRTDPNGYGTLNGVRPLDGGHYAYVLEVTDSDGQVVLDSWGDAQFFGVYR